MLKPVSVFERKELEALYTHPYTALLGLLTPPVLERLDFSSPVMLMSVGENNKKLSGRTNNLDGVHSNSRGHLSAFAPLHTRACRARETARML